MVSGVVIDTKHGEKFAFLNHSALPLAGSRIGNVMKVDIYHVVKGHWTWTVCKWTILIILTEILRICYFKNSKKEIWHLMSLVAHRIGRVELRTLNFEYFLLFSSGSNQITVVAFQPVQLAQASFLHKNQTLQNGFLISVTLRWHRASVACKNQSF